VSRLVVAVYAIAFNEAAFCERFYAPRSGAELVLIADTGSTDGTAQRLRQLGATVHEIAVRPWRFDVARNAALALLPGDVEVCIALDSDSSPVGEKPSTKIHARQGYRWINPCHEILWHFGDGTEAFVDIPGFWGPPLCGRKQIPRPIPPGARDGGARISTVGVGGVLRGSSPARASAPCGWYWT
jgi:glycosyltransferase involved in cell wall biosynthesis